MSARDITAHPVHLGLGATAEVEPLFTGAMDWYTDYATRHAEDGAEGRLVSMHAFDASWDIWEMHPRGNVAGARGSGQAVRRAPARQRGARRLQRGCPIPSRMPAPVSSSTRTSFEPAASSTTVRGGSPGASTPSTVPGRATTR